MGQSVGSVVGTWQKPIKFGTDGWRGTIAADFTLERVDLVAPLAAQVLEETYGETTKNRVIIVGYDRRFMAEQFAEVAAAAIARAGYDVQLSEEYAPTPAFSWIANHREALGAIVLTASHNPGQYLGLKIKAGFGGSVSGDVTKKVEAKLDTPAPDAAPPGTITTFHPKDTGYFEALREYVDIDTIQAAIAQGKLTVFADAMHGSSAGGLARILDTDQVREFNGDRDPLFKGGAPEPLPKYLQPSLDAIGDYGKANPDTLVVGLVFDGDCDRIGAVDRHGNFLSTQNLIPILIEHLASRRGMDGEVIKTVSGSDLMPKVAELFDLSVYETAVGYKYIADRMLSVPTLIGGEESGGVGYGCHIPERDALLSALYVLETVVKSGQDLSDLYADLQKRTGFDSAYDRTDLPLADMETRDRLLTRLANEPPTVIAGQTVESCQTTDGYKFRLADGRWLMIRFSGTEPVLRLYCEAATLEDVHATLGWAETWATES